VRGVLIDAPAWDAWVNITPIYDYVNLVNHAPELWGMMFAKTDKPRMART
jgi:hypothetical protein